MGCAGVRAWKWIAWFVLLYAAALPALAEDAAGDGGYSLFDPAPDSALRPFCTDRPTKGTGPCTVDAGHLQIESDIFNATSDDANGVTTDTLVYTSPNFRLGLTDTMDAELNISPFVEIETRDHRTGRTSIVSGFGDMVLRVKTSLVGNGAGYFSAAFDPFLKIPTAPAGIGNRAVEGGAVVPLAFVLSDVWSLSLVPEMDLLRNAEDSGRHVAGVVALGLTRAISSQLSASAEFWTNVDADPAGAVTQNSFDIAGSWQPPGSKDLQLDIGGNFGLNADTPAVQVYLGISHRF